MAIERSAEQSIFIRIETLRFIAEGIRREVLEGRLAFSHHDIDLSFQARGDQAVEPFGVQVVVPQVTEADDFRGVKLDLQPVRLHRLHAEVFLDDAVADLEDGLPQARLVVRAGLHRIGVDASDGGVVGLAGIHTVGGVADLHHDRIVVGEVSAKIRQHEVELQLIARAPHATVGIGECGDPFLDALTADVELAIGKRIAVVGLDDGLSSVTALCHDESGTVLAGQRHMAFAVGLSRGDLLPLVVIGDDFGARDRFGVGNLEHIDVSRLVITHLGSQGQVRDDDVLLRFHIIIIGQAERIVP